MPASRPTDSSRSSRLVPGAPELRAALFFFGAPLEIGEHAFDDGID